MHSLFGNSILPKKHINIGKCLEAEGLLNVVGVLFHSALFARIYYIFPQELYCILFFSTEKSISEGIVIMPEIKNASKSVGEVDKDQKIIATRNLTDSEIALINNRLDDLANEYYEKYF